tara:strand:+ start:17866 stop:18309 length:444 start_codon:yes stop_codon:yes gene_type:complete
MILKDWWYAYKVLKKYNLSYSVWGSGSYDFKSKRVSVSPFRNNFLRVVMHEVGHHVHHQRVNYKVYLYNPYADVFFGKKDYYRCLEAEAFASRFAMKVLKGDTSFYMKAFSTYTSALIEAIGNNNFKSDFMESVDVISRCSYRIEKF